MTNFVVIKILPRQCSSHITKVECLPREGVGGGLLSYMGYIGMRGPKGYGFSVVLVRNGVSILADFGHFDHK